MAKTPKTPKQSKTRKPKAETVDQADARPEIEPVKQIEFDDAVAQGTALVAANLKSIKSVKSNEMKLGELAHHIKPKYRDETLAKFAAAIGIHVAKLKKYRSVYRKYKGINGETSPVSFGAREALATHPKRDQIIRENPKIKVREARTLTKDYHVAQGLGPPGWEIDETKRWLAGALNVYKVYGHPAQKHLTRARLRGAFDDPHQAVEALDKGGHTLIALAKRVKEILANPEPPEPAPAPNPEPTPPAPLAPQAESPSLFNDATPETETARSVSL